MWLKKLRKSPIDRPDGKFGAKFEIIGLEVASRDTIIDGIFNVWQLQKIVPAAPEIRNTYSCVQGEQFTLRNF